MSNLVWYFKLHLCFGKESCFDSKLRIKSLHSSVNIYNVPIATCVDLSIQIAIDSNPTFSKIESVHD